MPDVSEEDSETTTLIQDDGGRCQVKILNSKWMIEHRSKNLIFFHSMIIHNKNY